MRSGVHPIGSRRRRAAIRSANNIPFEQLPYQCFQEAMKVLKADREEKLKLIATERLRISNVLAQDPSKFPGGEAQKQVKLESMRKHLEYLKIQADINDPLIKKRFEDGEGMYHYILGRITADRPLGDMSKPIYRYLADQKWREYQYKVIDQRIHQLSIVPDLLPVFKPTAEVRLAFRDRNVAPGEFVDSRVSEVPARLKVQVFDKGERLVTVVVVDSDVPLAEKDGFTSHCHFIAANIALSPTQTSVPLSHATAEQTVLPWLPPFAQKGSPYHRYSVLVLQQPEGKPLDVSALKKTFKRDGFKMRSFTQNTKTSPIGIGIFRSLWDEGTAGVMERAGIEGADIEFKRKRVVAIKPKQKPRGWEAKHKKDKYKPLGIRWAG